MADSIYTFDPTAINNSSLDSIPYGPNQLYHNKIDDLFRAYAAKLAQFVDDLGAVNTVSGTDTIAITLASAITAYATGQMFRFTAANTTTSTTVNINVNTIGNKRVRKISGGTDVDPAVGDIAAGETYLVIYRSSANSGNGAWMLIGGASVAAATTSAAGIVELATLAETLAGTDTSRAVVPANLYFPTGHISPSLTIAKNGSDASNDIDVSAFTARDSTDTYNIVCAARTKQIDAAWAVGTNAGGLDTGTVSNTTYYIWGIKRTDTGVCDVLFSLSASSPTMPTNYDARVLIGEFTRVAGVNGIPTVYSNPLVRSSGTAPIFACRAWVNFDGTGTVAIRSSGNVSSITDNGTGDYTVNFTTAMPDANYAIQTTGTDLSGSNQAILLPALTATPLTTTTARLNGRNSVSAAIVDMGLCCVSVFR